MKYRKRLVKHILARINEHSPATQIIKDVKILMRIWGVQEALYDETGTTIKNCIEKCEIINNDDLMQIEQEDLNRVHKYVNFYADISASEPLINKHITDWWQKSWEDCINTVLNESNIAQEISDDSNDDDDEEVDEIEDEALNFTESSKMLDIFFFR